MAARGSEPVGRNAGRLVLALIVGLIVPAVTEAAAPVGQWWSASYRYRQKLSLTSGATAIPTQYSVRLQFDHAGLVSVSQSLASGNDVRVAWWSGSAWVELDRLLDDQSAWNTTTTQVWFRTQAAIGASSTDDNYYLYYGNASAGAPPANWANVFLFYDDFADGVLDAARWTCADPLGAPPPACTESAVAPGTLSLQNSSAVYATAGLAFGTNTRWESRLSLAGVPTAGRFYNYWGASDMTVPTNPYQSDWITFYRDASQWLNNANNAAQTQVAPAPPIATPTSYHVYTFDREGAASVRFRQDGTQVGNNVTNLPDANLRVLVWNDDVTANGIVLDWVRVRKYVTPEPTFATAAAETGPSSMRVLSGTYTGNGVDNRPIFVGFQPDIVIVDRSQVADAAPREAVMRTSTMVGDVSKDMDGPNPVAADRIQSLSATGFTIGTNATVNEAGGTYHWVAFRGAPGQLKVGSYAGDGVTDNRSITGVGFQPDYVIVLPESAARAVHRSSAMPGDVTYEFNTQNFPDGIQALQSDGFQVGLDPRVNAAATNYYFAAWKATPGRVAVGFYTGTGVDNLNITGTGFLPEEVIVNRSNSGFRSVHKPASTGVATDLSLLFENRIGEADSIQALQVNGFQVGLNSRVNVAATNFYWIAFGPHTPQTYYRSIGTAANDTTGTLTATNSSVDVTGAGTLWKTKNRGRGDVITICDDVPTCLTNVNYVVAAVNSDTSLRLTTPYTGAGGAGKTFAVKRQFATLQAWEDCISFGGACPFFPVISASLVADDRSEVGIAYKDSVFTAPLVIDGSTTDATHTITLTADGVNRNYGLPGTGVVINSVAADANVIDVQDNSVTVEWMEITNAAAPTYGDGIQVQYIGAGPATQVVLRNNLIHNVKGCGLGSYENDGHVDIYNNIIHSATQCGVWINPPLLQAGSRIRILNNTIYGNNNEGIGNGLTPGSAAKGLLVRNNISVLNGFADFDCGPADALDAASSNNLSEDGTSGGCSPAGGAVTSAVPALQFVNAAGGNLHIGAGSTAANVGVDLSAVFVTDIDTGVRTGVWDIGADEFGATTAVKLQSFAAVAGDRSVVLEWRTASELDNLGFHLYRGPSEGGPWTRLTASLIPGLGSSAVGQAYSYRDTGLQNGTRYSYRLEDVDASSKTTSHGPVSAVPAAGAPGGAPGSEPASNSPGARKKAASAPSCPGWVVAAYGGMTGASASAATLSCTRHGDPEAVSLGVVSRDSRQATLELKTGGFYALHEASGRVRVFIPGFEVPQQAQAAALPQRRALVDAIVGRSVALGGVRGLDLARFSGLEPALVGKAEMQVSGDGTVRASRRDVGAGARELALGELVKLLPSVFVGETKSAVVEIAPLRYDARSRTLTLAKRVLVRLLFTGRELRESGRASHGRRDPGRGTPAEKAPAGEVLARLFTLGRGLHVASYEDLFPGQSKAVAVSQLSVERQGQAVRFHVEPSGASFGPGSQLYFYADTASSSSDFSSETAYELVRSSGAVMPFVLASPTSRALSTASTRTAGFELNRLYQPGLLDAPDLWLWDAAASGATRAESFTLTGVDAAGTATLDVYVQGASESGQAVDHHVSISVNGVPAGEAQFAGKKPYRISLSVPAGVLRQGANELELTNVADTGVSSLLFLDRFTIGYAQLGQLSGGVFEGIWTESGTATLTGASGSVALVDVTSATSAGTLPTAAVSSGGAAWLSGFEQTPGGVRFRAEAGHRYLAVSREALSKPRVAAPEASSLRATTNQADYLLITPKAFLPAAERLVSRRQDQGLAARAVSFEEITNEFGHGQPSAEAIRSFLAYAYQSWARPSPRYVLLLGDSTYDPRHFMTTSLASPLPALWVRTSYLWTASDPQLGAVNGDDEVPDLAIGRIPAGSLEEAQRLVEKLLAWEESGQGLSGPATLVADNPDLGGDFESNAQDIESSFLAGRSELLRLRELGQEARPRIQAALDAGLSYLDYVGHGGAAVWASENVWNSWDAASLQAQSRQPLLLTLNCLNGYFVAPAFDSLSESLTKAEGRGAIAAFSPSGLSLDAPAHQYHRALMAELVSGQHERLGDAVLAAQRAYAQTGLMPELLSVYHLLGDPAMRIR